MLALAIASAAPAQACGHECVGFAWYSDGQYQKSGSSGVVLFAYAAGAAPNRTYQFVSCTPDQFDERCTDDIQPLNPNPRVPNQSGVIGNTGGVLVRPPGTYWITFITADRAFLTLPVIYTVI